MNDIQTKNYIKKYIEELKRDMCAFAGMEIIRRTIGDTLVRDITDVDEKYRVETDIALIKKGINLIMVEEKKHERGL